MASRLTTLILGVVALVCWTAMFLAGTDVWHDLGRPDLWNRPGPPYADLRAFTIAFYALFFVLAAHLIVAAWSLLAGAERLPFRGKRSCT